MVVYHFQKIFRSEKAQFDPFVAALRDQWDVTPSVNVI
jgi:hypothetical protein